MPDKGFNASTGLLRSKKINFLLVGAHALAMHKYPRVTGVLIFAGGPTQST